MIVYKTTNMISGKQYIGSDSNNNPNYLGGGTGLNLAIKKYGRKNFKKETIVECSSYEEMRELEEYHIKINKADTSNKFYNRSPIGQGCPPGELHWNYGKTMSEETVHKKSKSMEGKIIHTPESKDSISKKMKGEWANNPNMVNRILHGINPNKRKKLVQLDENNHIVKIWPAKSIAADTLGINRVSIGNVCNPNHHSTQYKGFIWKYVR